MKLKPAASRTSGGRLKRGRIDDYYPSVIRKHFTVDRIEVGKHDEGSDVPDVVKPPAIDRPCDVAKAYFPVGGHVEAIADPGIHAHPGRNDHPLVAPPLHLMNLCVRTECLRGSLPSLQS